MDPDFIAGLQVTGLGMGLVFLTLILIMLIIMALGRIFRPTVEEEVEAMPEALAPPAPMLAIAPAETDADEAAAVALAIAVARASRAARPVRASAAPYLTPEIEYDGIAGEVISVIRVEPGPSPWSLRGRINAQS